MAGEDLEQVELAPGEVQVAAAAGGDVAARVDDHVADHERTGARRAAAAQQRLQARGQLRDRERLDQVVVGARLQPGDAVLDLVARGQDADRDVDAPGAQPPDDRHAVEVGHRHVEDDDSRRALRDRLERLAAAGGGGDGEALEAQGALEGCSDRSLVVDDEDERLNDRPRSHAWSVVPVSVDARRRPAAPRAAAPSASGRAAPGAAGRPPQAADGAR